MNSDFSSGDGDALSEQRASLDQLVLWEHELAVLNELESSLEVDKISADVALKAATSKHDFPVTMTDAEEIARARAKKQELQATLEGRTKEASPSASDLKAELERLRAGGEALKAWRDAPETVSAWRRPRVANTVLIIACIAAVWAAIALHPVYLVLLVPLVMAISYFTFTAQDADWVRLGAVRRFQETRLKLPSSWEPKPVETRMAELEDSAAKLEQRITDLESHPEDVADDENNTASELAISMLLVDANDAYEAALKKAGISEEALSGEVLDWLELIQDSQRIAAELNEVRSKRKSISRQAEDTRDALFRFLALKDEAPPEGHADTEALKAGLVRVEKRLN